MELELALWMGEKFVVQEMHGFAKRYLTDFWGVDEMGCEDVLVIIFSRTLGICARDL